MSDQVRKVASISSNKSYLVCVRVLQQLPNICRFLCILTAIKDLVLATKYVLLTSISVMTVYLTENQTHIKRGEKNISTFKIIAHALMRRHPWLCNCKAYIHTPYVTSITTLVSSICVGASSRLLQGGPTNTGATSMFDCPHLQNT